MVNSPLHVRLVVVSVPAARKRNSNDRSSSLLSRSPCSSTLISELSKSSVGFLRRTSMWCSKYAPASRMTALMRATTSGARIGSMPMPTTSAQGLSTALSSDGKPSRNARTLAGSGSPRSWTMSMCPRLRQAEPYSPREVRARLVDETSQADPRTAAVHAAAAQVGAWMRLLPGDAAREHRLGLAASRLPSVVFWYRQGLSSEEIGRRLTPFGCRCYGDRAINAACTLIAALLNGGWAP